MYAQMCRSIKQVVPFHVLNNVEQMLSSLVRFVVVIGWACQASAINSVGDRHRSYTWWQHKYSSIASYWQGASPKLQGTGYLTSLAHSSIAWTHSHSHLCIFSPMVAPSPPLT